jgi:hypothetical protein
VEGNWFVALRSGRCSSDLRVAAKREAAWKKQSEPRTLNPVMFPAWRLRLREARVAWQNGRYDDASALLMAESLREFLPAKRLAQDVAEKIVERASERFARGDSAAGWRDLAAASRLSGETEAIGRLRKDYAEQTIAEAQSYLAAGQAAPALAQLEKLQKHGLADGRMRVLVRTAELMQQAEQSAARGHFSEAAAALAKAAELAKPQAAGLDTMDEIARRLQADSQRLASQGAECQRLSGEMHAALSTENWPAVLSAADALLSLAPEHVAAGQARRRAWRAVGLDVTQP